MYSGHQPGLGRLSPHFFRLIILVCQIRHCFFPIINKRHKLASFISTLGSVLFLAYISFTDKLCFQNKSLQTCHVYETKQKFTNTLRLQNNTKTKCLQTSYVYKTKQKVYKQVVYKTKFTNTLCLQSITKSLQTRYVYKTKQ